MNAQEKNLQRQRETMTAAARRYAAANKSDPFAYSRAMSHLKHGVASFIRGHSDPAHGLDWNDSAFYDAQPVAETRKTADGAEYTITTYRNIKRV